MVGGLITDSVNVMKYPLSYTRFYAVVSTFVLWQRKNVLHARWRSTQKVVYVPSADMSFQAAAVL
jgi:hypothetical protein